MSAKFEIVHAEDRSVDVLFGIIVLIFAGFAASSAWSSVAPLRWSKALFRSWSVVPSLVGMPTSAWRACVKMLVEFESKTDPIATAVKEAKSGREDAKRLQMPRVPSLPTLEEVEEEWRLPSPHSSPSVQTRPLEVRDLDTMSAYWSVERRARAVTMPRACCALDTGQMVVPRSKMLLPALASPRVTATGERSRETLCMSSDDECLPRSVLSLLGMDSLSQTWYRMEYRLSVVGGSCLVTPGAYAFVGQLSAGDR